jgi:hypothetical protein
MYHVDITFSTTLGDSANSTASSTMIIDEPVSLGLTKAPSFPHLSLFSCSFSSYYHFKVI